MTMLLEAQRHCPVDCLICSPPFLTGEMFPGFNVRLVERSIVVANHRPSLEELYRSKEDPWVSGDITQNTFPMKPGSLLYFWVGYLTSKSDEDSTLEIFRELIGSEGKKGWHLGGLEHLFLIGRLRPEEVIEGASIIGLRESGKVRGKDYWPRLMHGEGLSLVPYGEKKISPATRVLIVHEGRI